MEKLWLQIKAFYTNLPGYIKITGNTILSMIVSKLILQVNDDLIYIDLFWKDIALYVLTGLLATLNNEVLKFRNSDVRKANASPNMNIDVTNTSPTSINIK